MRLVALALGGLLAACSGSGSGTDGGSCTLDSQCPQIDCACSGGTGVARACLCEGGRTASGSCGPGGVCATSSECEDACAQNVGLGGTTGGSGGGGGGAQPCASTAECQPLTCLCPDAGSTQVTTVCLQGFCTAETSCPGC